MNPETIQRSRELAIHLDKDAYFPGETMSGLIYREAFINTRSAVVMVCIHGESKVLLDSIGSAKKYYSCFVLARTCQKDPCILRRGPLRIWDGEGECWRFSFKIPFFADSTENEQTSSPSYTPVGATNHQVPPSYTLQKHGIVNACVEYYVCAKLLYPTGAGGTTWTEVVNATHPFKLVQRSPNPPIDYSALKRWRHPKTIRSARLATGTKSHWARRPLCRTSFPKFEFDLLFELPTTIQLDNPTPIPLRLAVYPDWGESDQSLRGLPQKVKLVSIELLLETHTRFILQRGEREFTTELNLDLARAIRRLRSEINIPCTTIWEPVDIGELIDFRLELINEPGFPKASLAMEITPSFRTYNMTVTHKLAWKIHVKIAGEAFIVGGKADVLILRSSDGRLPGSSDQSPSVPVGTGTETELEAPETGPGGSALWDEEDDSWIVPPPEDEAPPSFADACSLSAALVSIHFQSDKERGEVQGPGEIRFYEAGMDRDMPENPTLQAYLTHRHVAVSDDEAKYFECLWKERPVDLPVFLVAAAEDNLRRISKTDGFSLAAVKALLEFVVEDDLIREEVVEIFLYPEPF